jgi:hypothetical protein
MAKKAAGNIEGESQALKDYKAKKKALAEAGKALVEPLVKQLDGVIENAKELEKDGIDLKDLKAAVKKLSRVLEPPPKPETWWVADEVENWMKLNANNKANKKGRQAIEDGVLGENSGKKFQGKGWAAFTSDKCRSEGNAAKKEYWLKQG